MTIPRFLQVIDLGAWGKLNDGLAWADGVHLQIEAIQNDAILLQGPLSNDARNVGPGQNWGSEFRKLRMAAILVEAMIDANAELGVMIGLLGAGSDPADSQRHLAWSGFRFRDSVFAAGLEDVLVEFLAHQVIGAASVNEKAAPRFP